MASLVSLLKPSTTAAKGSMTPRFTTPISAASPSNPALSRKDYRYIVYNRQAKEAVTSTPLTSANNCPKVGLIFPNGYYLSNGNSKSSPMKPTITNTSDNSAHPMAKISHISTTGSTASTLTTV